MSTGATRPRATSPVKPGRKGTKRKASATGPALADTTNQPRAKRPVAVVLAELAKMAAALRSCRGDRTQRVFAAELGLRRPTLAFWELGRGRPDISSAIAIELATNGELPIETFGYSAESALKLARFRSERANSAAKVA